MLRTPGDCEDLIVVDPNFDEYERLVGEFRASGRLAACFATGEETLRAAAAGQATLWMINARLADMSGTYLLRLIRCRLPRANILLIGDSYSPDVERDARSAGATAYLCKPVSPDWLDALAPRCRSPAIRAGPNRRAASTKSS